MTNWDVDTTPAYIEMAYWHSLYDTALYDLMNFNNCDYGGLDPDLSTQCIEYYVEFARLTEDINVYNIFGTCWGLGNAPMLYASNEETTPKKAYSHKDYTPWMDRVSHKLKSEHPMLQELPPCTWGSGLLDYFNQIEVRQALHIPMHIQAWDLCTEEITYNIEDKGS